MKDVVTVYSVYITVMSQILYVFQILNQVSPSAESEVNLKSI